MWVRVVCVRWRVIPLWQVGTLLWVITINLRLDWRVGKVRLVTMTAISMVGSRTLSMLIGAIVCSS